MNHNIQRDLAVFANHLATELEAKPMLVIKELLRADHKNTWEAFDRFQMENCKSVYHRKRASLRYPSQVM